MILVKTCYETHNGQLLAIIETFKICHHNLKSCKQKVLVFSHHNNLYCFKNVKNLGSYKG